MWREIPRSWSLIIFYFFYIQVGVFDGFGQKPYWGRNLAAFVLVSGRNPKVRPCHGVCNKMPLSGYREWKNILIFQFTNIWWKLFHLLHDEVFRANIIRYGFLSGYYLSFALSLLPVLHGVVSEAIQFLSWLFIR